MAAFVVALAAASLSAQDKPDFSGDWILESEAAAADIPRAMSVKQLVVSTSVRGEPMTPFFKDISITRMIGTTSSSSTYPIGTIGGSVFGARSGEAPPRSWHRVVWDEQALVFEQGTYTGPTQDSGDWTAWGEVWSFDADGRLRVVMTARGSDRPPTTVIAVYRRR